MNFYDDMLKVKRKYADVRLDIHFDEFEYIEGKKLMVLDAIVVPKVMRHCGMGTNIMQELVRIAKKYHCIFMLSPDDSLGATSKARLRRFYKRFGFVDNKGKRKSYQLPLYSMYLMP